MAGLTPQQQRALRRRHKHERQAVVFGALIAALALAGLGATAVYTGAMDAPFLTRDFTTPSPDAAPEIPKAPCPPADTLPVALPSIQLRVLNSTGTSGLAGTASTTLTAAGFVVLEVGNYPMKVTGGSRIQFGEAGLAAAYTLAAYLDNTTPVLDTRQDATVDLILGTEWAGLLDPATVILDPTLPLEPITGCVPLEEALATAIPGPTATPTPTPEGEPAAGG